MSAGKALKGIEGSLAENHAAILATLGRSRVGVKAEALLRKAAADVKANGGKPVPLDAKGADCIAAAHAFAAEPPGTLPAQTAMPTSDGETLPGQGVERLADGQINPTCAWRWQKKPITVEFDFGEEREIGGVRLMAGRSWVNCGVKTASFYAVLCFEGAGDLVTPLAEHVEFRPSHTYKENVATWKPDRKSVV